nr:MAG TPA: hypothetical protein [Caudoviricetes sp.]DAO60589.1 MAG TPA: hypothetical protein [Caudoviricetes sp.]
MNTYTFNVYLYNNLRIFLHIYVLFCIFAIIKS